MADPQTGLRSFVLADFPDLAFFGYYECCDASHEPSHLDYCTYRDKALLVDEMLQRAATVHILSCWAYHPGYRMQDVGYGPWQVIQKAIQEQDEAQEQAKMNSRPLNSPGVWQTQSQWKTPSVITEGLREYLDANEKAAFALAHATAGQPVSNRVDHPAYILNPPLARNPADGPCPAFIAAPLPGMPCPQPCAPPPTLKTKDEATCDSLKQHPTKADVIKIKQSYKAATKTPTPAPTPSSDKQGDDKKDSGPPIDDPRYRLWKETEDLKYGRTKLTADPEPSFRHTKQAHHEDKEWEFVEDDSLKEDYMMIWPAQLPEPGVEWELVLR